MMRQTTVRMRGQDVLTERKEDEGSEGNVRMTIRQRGRGTEGHEWVIGGQRRRETEWITLRQEKESNMAMSANM